MKYLDDLVFWVMERERIRIKKQDGYPAPWTTDPVLATYRFCNVQREDDKVTVWIRENWRNPAAGLPSLPFAMAVARMVNWPDTLQELGYPDVWDPQRFVNVLRARADRGEKVWTSAYMITGGYSAGGETKEVIIARVLTHLHRQLEANPVRCGDTLAEAAEKLKSPGIGSFLSAQMVADLKGDDLLYDAVDWWTWCSPGPGSTMGLNFVHDRPEIAAIQPKQFRSEINEIRGIIFRETGMPLCAQNTQNVMCELSKYIRVKYLGRRLKTQYRPSN